MKSRILSISTLLFLVLGFLVVVKSPAGLVPHPVPAVPCQTPLTYRIGNIDSRFNISKKKLKTVMKEVDDLWATAMDRDLLNYDPEGEVVINLVYSKDQRRTERERSLSNRIEVLGKQIELAKTDSKQLMHTYQSHKKDLQNMIAQHEKRVLEFNRDVMSWKIEGGIPKSKKEEFEKRRRQISLLESRIKRKQNIVEDERNRLNATSNHLTSLVDIRNDLVAKYNQSFSTSSKFNQGEYIKDGDERKIEIYQFSNRAELKTVLAHETGHAMGLGHVNNPKSIMNAIMKEQDIFHLSLTKADIKAIKDRCN